MMKLLWKWFERLTSHPSDSQVPDIDTMEKCPSCFSHDRGLRFIAMNNRKCLDNWHES